MNRKQKFMSLLHEKMPRPGPRPYECVRKAWHSDRHQPIRGSLIQEIFRVVNEIHSSSTRKNKEWQEKLPIVVLKAEEIMYSKANSEAEYMDLDTLLDRTNDAINTIIRRDETTESGELLQPCIEAALTLGCTPRRTSRSQRNNSPRRYLGSNPRESPTDRHGIVEKSTLGNPAIISDSMPLNPCSSNFESMISAKLDHVPFFRAINPAIPVQTHPTANSISIYPFGSCPQAERSPSHFAPAHSQHNHEENFQNHPIDSVDVSKTFTLKRATYISQNSPQLDCDLSLRLGPHSAKDVNTQTCCQPREIEHGDPTAARDANTFGELRLGSDHHQFAFFRREDADHLSNRFSVKRSFGSEQLKVLDQSMRKKSAFCGFYFVEDQQCRWQPKHSLKHKDETKAKCRFVD